MPRAWLKTVLLLVCVLSSGSLIRGGSITPPNTAASSKPISVMFTGYQVLNGQVFFQFHFTDTPPSGQPRLKKSGDPLGFGGYTVGAFHQEFNDQIDPNIHQVVHVDVSTVEIIKIATGTKTLIPFRRMVPLPN